MNAQSFAVFQLLAFLAAATPLLLENINHWTVSNRNNAILFGGGLFVSAIGIALGLSELSLAGVGLGFAIAFGLVVLSATRMVPGGVMKTCIALLPWFSIGSWLVVFAVGMLLAAILGIAFKRNVLIAPPILGSGGMVLLLPLFG